ncbi:MAG TPA: type II toxin-antitoxin system VapC family toxin [Anaerolineales bacterium]|nr:type II toxin-antitoxin system VapC family toxin [Anaerolineales bacterium]
MTSGLDGVGINRMVLPDVNVLVHAHREDAPGHLIFRGWLEGVINGPQAYGYSDLVVSGFLRIVTHPRIFSRPTDLKSASAFTEIIRSQPNAVPISPGPRHWEIFSDLCRKAGAKGNLVPDAFLAALAIESGSEWITTDRDYSRFAGLKWRHPLG